MSRRAWTRSKRHREQMCADGVSDEVGVEAYTAFSSPFCARPTFPWLNTSNSVLSGTGEMWGRVKPDSQLGHGEGVGCEKAEGKPMEGGCHTRPQACCWGEERLVSLRSCSDDILRSSEVYKDEDVMHQKEVLSIFHFSIITNWVLKFYLEVNLIISQ